MAASPPALRAQLQAALQNLATGNLADSATQLLATLGYASPKTLALPTDPAAFAKQIESLTGGAKQLNPEHASLADWHSAAFLFQLTNDELPTLAAGQMSLLAPASGVQAWQVESSVFLAIDLKPGTWSRTRLSALTLLRKNKIPRSSALYKNIASQITSKTCTDNAFLMLKNTLIRWF